MHVARFNARGSRDRHVVDHTPGFQWSTVLFVECTYSWSAPSLAWQLQVAIRPLFRQAVLKS
jgi:hypothetical protein